MKKYDDEVNEKIASLPSDVRAMIFADSVGLKLRAIGTRYGLLLDQVTYLTVETRLVLLGVISQETFASDLVAELKVTPAVAAAITKDISTDITSTIIAAMQSQHPGEENSRMSDEEIDALLAEENETDNDFTQAGIEVLPDSTVEQEAPTINRETLLAGVENPSIFGTIQAPRTAADEIQRGITGEKLAGSFKIPGEQKDYSVNKSDPQASKQIPVIRHRDRVDPYREALD